MKENEDKNIRQFVDRVMKETSLESPSYNFTSKVMANVLAVNKSKATTYKPLISRKGWILIFAGIIAVLLYLLLSDSTQAANHSWLIDLSGKNFIPALNSSNLFQFSRLTINVVVAATVLVLIQIAMLKSYLNKRLTK
jgi:hypothetical protein